MRSIVYLSILLLVGCTQIKQPEPPFQRVGAIDFRRSYAMDPELWSEERIDSISKELPIAGLSQLDSTGQKVMEMLIKAGLAKGDKLLISKCRDLAKDSMKYVTRDHKELHLKIEPEYPEHYLTVRQGAQSSRLLLTGRDLLPKMFEFDLFRKVF